MDTDERPVMGVSACLLGQNVRYDGNHSRDPYVCDTLGRWFRHLPVCPEVECGLPVPREPMRLEGDPEDPRLVTINTRKDLSFSMKNWAEKRLDGLDHEDLCGFIFKSRSPSSGMTRVKVYNEKGVPEPKGSGIFARAFMERFPLVPVEEEGRLNDPVLREKFIEKVFVFLRFRKMLRERATPAGLVDFHTRHKLLLMSHSPELYRKMGKMTAEAGTRDLAALFAEYAASLNQALSHTATPARNVNVLMHIIGYFKNRLDSSDKAEFLELLESYRKGRLPLIVPITLCGHYVRKFREPYLMDQVYLSPHPAEMGLRNHV